MTSATTALIGKLVTITALLQCFSNAVAEELYQWKDKDGTITYSTTPPPAEITTNYQEVSTKRESPSIKSAKPTAAATKTPKSKVIVQPAEPLTVKNESRLERLVRLSPEPVKKPQPQIRESILQPVNQDKVRKLRKCRDLSNRVGALEARLHSVSSADELNESMLLLTTYQNSFDRYCN